MNASALASLTAVRKRFGKTQALDGFDLEIRRGELLALLGPNGAGKTTAISLFLGLQQADEGNVLLFGRSPLDVAARRNIGVMMQEAAFPQELRVDELIHLIGSYYVAPLTVRETLQRANITELASRRYGKLSGGQKRQVQFALAICGQPQLLFLDEPTVGLDVQARELVWTSIRELLAQGCSIVLTTHYLEEAEALASRVAVMTRGRLIANGGVDEMRRLVLRRRVSCRTTTTLENVLAWPNVDRAQLDGDRLSITTTNAETVVRRLLASDADLQELEVNRVGLAEVFTQLTQEAA